MSGLEVAAAVVGISDVAIRSISTFYDLLNNVKEAPEAIYHLRQETGAVLQALEGLIFVENANGDVQERAKRVGLAEAVNQCGNSCNSLTKNLDKWTKSGDGLAAKLQFVRHKAQVTKCCTQIATAKGTVGLAVNIASLAILAGSSSASDVQRREQVTSLEQEIAGLQEEARNQREEAEKAVQTLQQRVVQDEDDLDAQLAVPEVKQQKEACEQLWASCLAAEEEVQALAKVDVIVGDMIADRNSRNDAGVPKEVLKKLAQARVKVGNMTASNGSVNRAGIF